MKINIQEYHPLKNHGRPDLSRWQVTFEYDDGTIEVTRDFHSREEAIHWAFEKNKR